MAVAAVMGVAAVRAICTDVKSLLADSLNPGVRRRELLGWAMYDFANSGYTTVVITAVFAAYFVGGVAGGASWATLAWTSGLSVSYAIVMLTMPGLGAWADRHAAKKRLLLLATLGCVVSTAALALVGPGDVLLGLALLGVRVWVGAGKAWLDKRWGWGAIALAVLATLNLLLAGQPWGVVYGFGLWAAKVSVALGAFDPAANAFWSQAGNAQRLTQTVLMDVTTITSIGILAGALWVSAKTPATNKPLTAQQWAIGLVAGFVMGYSSRLAFGCNVGAMLSGISTGSLHGWIWVPMAFAGTLVGVRVRRRFGF